ncbi:unnamed protein product [Blepharisma stoltei]|uniref:Cyclin n=1 Tax=Blepharisma stoltei TaxID=1481888 RepID=A0AAU9JDZ4_9CILI|nr:unnamed protein product [Blepharisma stoltei]
MISKTFSSTLNFTQWINSRSPEILDLIHSISRALYIEIEYFCKEIRINPRAVNLENIPESDYFSYQDNYNSCYDEKLARPVDIQEISEFVQTLYKEFKFSKECFVLTMVYIKKFLFYSKIPLMSDNWKNILLISTLVAQRVSDNAIISASDYNNIKGFSLEDIRLMEIDFLNFIGYDYKLEAIEYLYQSNYLQDISKSIKGNTWYLDNEKLENIMKRSKQLSEEESDSDCGIYHSEAMHSIDIDLIDY